MEHENSGTRRKCGGRKRFVKLMMAEGIRRNNAAWLAGVVRELSMTYREAWSTYLQHDMRRRAYEDRID